MRRALVLLSERRVIARQRQQPQLAVSSRPLTTQIARAMMGERPDILVAGHIAIRIDGRDEYAHPGRRRLALIAQRDGGM